MSNENFPLLLLLPGLDGSAELFAPLLEQIPACYPHLALRYPADLNWQLSDYADYVCQQVQGIDHIVIIAESFSGPVAILVAQGLQQRCQGLILAASFCTCPNPLLKWLQFALPLFPCKWLPLAITTRLLFAQARCDLIASFQRVWHALEPDLIRRRLQLLATLDLRAELARLSTQILYLQARQDYLVSAHAQADLVAAHPAIKFIELAAPHGMLQTQAPACWQQIQPWLRELGTKSRAAKVDVE